MISNYEALQDVSTTINQECHDDYGRRAGGVLAQIEKFDTFFGLELGKLVFGDTTVMDAIHATELAQSHLRKLRREESFTKFYEDTKTRAANLTEEPTLPCYRRAPKGLMMVVYRIGMKVQSPTTDSSTLKSSNWSMEKSRKGLISAH